MDAFPSSSPFYKLWYPSPPELLAAVVEGAGVDEGVAAVDHAVVAVVAVVDLVVEAEAPPRRPEDSPDAPER